MSDETAIPSAFDNKTVLVGRDGAYDTEPAQLAAWSTLRASAIEDAKDARIAELERIVDQQRGQFEALRGSFIAVNKRNQARIEVLEKALKPFADAATDADVKGSLPDAEFYFYSTSGDPHYHHEKWYGYVYTDPLDERYGESILCVSHARRAYEVLYGHPAPTTSESEADNE